MDEPFGSIKTMEWGLRMTLTDGSFIFIPCDGKEDLVEILTENVPEVSRPKEAPKSTFQKAGKKK